MVSDDDIFVCRKKNGCSTIEPFSSLPVFRKAEIDHAFDDEIPTTSVSQRIQRGDFD